MQFQLQYTALIIVSQKLTFSQTQSFIIKPTLQTKLKFKILINRTKHLIIHSPISQLLQSLSLIPKPMEKNQQLTANKKVFKTLCIHWKRLPPQLMFPSLKETFSWVSLENGQPLDKNVNKDHLHSEIIQTKNLQQSNLFINRHTLLIYCVTCKKQIFDFYPSASSSDDILIMQKQKLTPFPIRDYFLKPLNEQAMFYSNLEYPKSFQKEKKNSAILISEFKNTFLESVIRLFAFTPTLCAISQNIDTSKIKSPVLQSLFSLLHTMSSGQCRILKINTFQSVFFSQFPQFLSYENHKPISVMFKIFTEIQNEFKYTDSLCKAKEIISEVRTQWGFGKPVGKYSPLREMLLSKFSNVEECFKCHNFHMENTLTRQFECLKLQPVTGSIPYFANTLAKRKSIDLNIIKAIESTLESQIPYFSQNTKHHCVKCGIDTLHQTKVILKPGNYLFFEVLTKESVKLVIPKQINLNQLNARNFIIDEPSPAYEFVGGIYKDSKDQLLYPQEFGTVVYHNQNKKYLNFDERNSTEHDTIALEKPFNVLLYKQKPNELNTPITKNIKSTLYLMEQNQLQVQNPIPLPDLYQIYLSQHFKIPPLLNPYICHHGKQNIRIQEITKCTKINYIPVEIYNFLVDTFGGRKVNQKDIKQSGSQCKLCIKGLDTLNQLKTIQKSAMKYVDNFSVKKGQVLIYKPWLDQWKAFLYQKSKQNYTQWGNPPPTEINNYLGMKQNNPKTIDYSKYTKISFEVWLALSMFHCGGPQLTIKKVVKNNSVKNYIQMRLDEAKNMYVELGKCLSIQSRKVMKIIGNNSTIPETNEDQCEDQQILSERGHEEDNLTNELHKKQKSQSQEKQRNRLFSRQKSSSFIKNKI